MVPARKSIWLYPLNVKTDSPDTKRRGRLLALCALVLLPILGIYTVYNFYRWIFLASLDDRLYFIQDFLSVLFFLTILVLNKRGFVNIASHFSLSFIVFSVSFLFPEDPSQAFFLFAIPIALAGFILTPPSVFLYLAQALAGYALALIYADFTDRYLDMKIVGVLVISLISYFTARHLKRIINDAEKSESDFRSLFDNAPVGLYRIACDGRILDVNPALIRMGRFQTRDSALNSNVKDFYADPPKLAMRNKNIRASATVHKEQIQLRRPDGTVFWAEDYARAIRDDKGNILYYEGSLIDITERKQAELLQQAMYQIASETQKAETLDQLYKSIHQTLALLMPVENFYIALYDRQKDLISFPYDIDQYDEPALPQRPGNGLTEYVLRAQRPLLIYDEEVIEWVRRGKIDLIGNNSIAWMGAPLIVDGQAIGVVATQTYDPSVQLTQKHLDLLAYVSTQIAMAIHRKQTEQELKESRARLELFFSQSLDGFFFMELEEPIEWDENSDKDNLVDYALGHEHVVKVNDALIGQYGVPQEIVVGLSPGTIFAHDIPLARRIWRQLFDNGSVQIITEERKADGTPMWIEADYICVRDAEGRIAGHFGIQREITERRNLEIALRESEWNYRNLVDNALVGVFKASVNREILYANQALVNAFGFDSLESYKTSGEIIPYRNPEERNSLFKLLHAEGRVENLEIAALKADGSDITILLNATLDGEIINGMIMDITEQKSARQKIVQQIDQLESLRMIDNAIMGGTDLHSTMNVVLEHAQKRLEMDALDILILDPIAHTLHFEAGLGFKTSGAQKANIRLGSEIAGRVALERKSLQGHNLSKDEFAAYAPLLVNEGFTCFHAIPLISKGEVKGVLEVFNRKHVERSRDWYEFFETLAGQAAIAIDNTTLFNDLQKSNAELNIAYESALEGWSNALDMRDREPEGHTQRVTDLALKLAGLMGLDIPDLIQIRRGSLLHDIGKMAVPDHILYKPDSLTDDEWAEMRKHPLYAHKMLSPIKYLDQAVDIPYCHHEKWDGTGYPRGLKGIQIPLFARIFAVADVYDALTSDRPYRKAWTKERAIQHIRDISGTHLDPDIVDIFLNKLRP